MTRHLLGIAGQHHNLWYMMQFVAALFGRRIPKIPPTPPGDPVVAFVVCPKVGCMMQRLDRFIERFTDRLATKVAAHLSLDIWLGGIRTDLARVLIALEKQATPSSGATRHYDGDGIEISQDVALALARVGAPTKTVRNQAGR